MTVQLIIKSAAQSVEDFALNCEMSWTILEVKDQISNLYPSKPKREHQKLIYGGKLLPDDLSLKSILNQVQDIHVLHLVCPLPPFSEVDKKNVTKEKTAPPVCAGTPPLNPVYPQLNQQILTTGLTSGMPVVPGVALNPPSDAVQQYLAMHQMYTQFMTRYFAQYNGSNPYVPTNTINPPVQQQPAAAPIPNDLENMPQSRQPEEDEDYIDYLYAFVRVFILSTLLLYYSSLTRVVAVSLMVLLITMFARINRRHQREELQREADRRQTTEDAPSEQVPADNQTSDNESVVEDSADTETISQPEIPNETSVPSTIVTLIKAFFSSLIPTDPLPINVN